MSSGGSTITEPLIGYCHQCDRQVQINRDEFTCGQCSSGFVELFDMDTQSRNNNNNNNNSNNNNSSSGASGGRSSGNQNIPDLLPMFFPQLLGMADAAGGGNSASANNFFGPLFEASGVRHGAGQAGPGPARFQVIVPSRAAPGAAEGGGVGEQFDLYGIINSVISDLLDPRRSGMAPHPPGQPQSFHFQSPPIRMFQIHGDLRDYAWGSNGLDAIITQLLNQLENTGPPPASEDQLKNLPEVSISQEEVEKNVQCAICMEDFNLADKAKKLPCKHLFHQPCISEWLKLHGTCPVCRKNLNGEDTSQREYISRPPPNNQSSTGPSSSTSSSTTDTSNTHNPDSSSSSSSNTQSGSHATTTTSTTNPSSTSRAEPPSSSSNNTNYYEPDID